MSHNIRENDHMVSADNVRPWHGLGTILPDESLTASQALKAAKLDWTVTSSDVFDPDMQQVKGYKLNRRSDDKTVLSLTRTTWTPVQNEILLEIADSLAQAGEALTYKPRIETAGSLLGGKIVWALVKVNEAKCLGSTHEQYLLLSNGHDGARSVKGTLTDVRVVCNNTLSAAEASAAQFRVNHTKNVVVRVEDAIKTLGWANEQTEATFAIYKALAKQKVTGDEAVSFFNEITPGAKDPTNKRASAKVDILMNLFRNGPGVEGKTRFDLVNAVTDYVDHHRAFRVKDGNDERRFLFSSFGGEGDRLKTHALHLAQGIFSNADR